MEQQLQLLPSFDIPTPTLTPSDQLAAELHEAIDALAGRISQLESPHPSTARHVRGARTVSREFIMSMIAAVEELEELRTLGTFDVGEARAMLQFNDALRHVVDRLEMLVASINYTMASRKAKVTFDAMRTYAVAKGMARDRGGARLIPHLEALKRDLGRKAGAAP